MVRVVDGGQGADEFAARNLVAIGWGQIGSLDAYAAKAELQAAVEKQYPDWTQGRHCASASQLERFRRKLKVDNRV